MNISKARYTLAALSAALLLTAGCSGSGPGDKTGSISLGISDHPMHDATKVCIAFTEVELKPKEGPPIMAEPFMEATSNINVLDFQGMNAAPLLMNFELPAGELEWIRLGVNAVRGGMGGFDENGVPDTDALGPCLGDESYVMMGGLDGLDGITNNLYIPSGAQSGLKLHGDIIIPNGGAADFTAEIDLMKSIASPAGLEPDRIFRPTIRLENNLEVGALTGQVIDLVVDGCAPSVFIFEDDDMDAPLDVTNSLTSAMVNEQINDVGMTEYHYTFGFLPGGDYEIAFSCDDGLNLNPPNGKLAMAVVGEVAEVDLP